MKWIRLLIFGALLFASGELLAVVTFELTSPYHHVRVVDEGGIRILYFDNAPETRMSLQDPSKGNFEYTDYFHMAWLWNTQVNHALMIGLGGASIQKSFAQHYPKVLVESVEIDPIVVQVARDYFHFKESERQKVHVADGRVFLRRSKATYDLIVLDAYVQGRYGSAIPQHLATREFFELARDHLSTNGVVAYNVIGSTTGWRADMIGAMYRTMKAVFPQVYLFPARTSQNIVFIATKASHKAELTALRRRADLLATTRQVTLPGFRQRLENLNPMPPPNAARSPILTDDYAPVEGLSAP